MKKLVFGLIATVALGFVGNASNSVQNIILPSSSNISTENSSQREKLVLRPSCPITLSCGISGTLSWPSGTSTADIMDAVAYFDDLLC